MKKLFFLLAAVPALLVSCSSDELDGVTTGVDNENPSAVAGQGVSMGGSVEFTNGAGIGVGSLTRTGGGCYEPEKAKCHNACKYRGSKIELDSYCKYCYEKLGDNAVGFWNSLKNVGNRGWGYEEFMEKWGYMYHSKKEAEELNDKECGGEQGGSGEEGEGGHEGEGGDDTTEPGIVVPAGANFVLNLTEDVLQNMLKQTGAVRIEADDFAIRVNGDYIPEIVPTEKVYQWAENGVVIAENEGLGVSLLGLDKLDFTDEQTDYTFELYMWVANEKYAYDGTESVVEFFDDNMKANWITEGVWSDALTLDGVLAENGGETGVDLTKTISEQENPYIIGKGLTDELDLLIRYTVYRGLQGNGLNTPYIKVSISVTKNKLTGSKTEVLPIYYN